MAANYTSDSYNRCIAELRNRYVGRGVGENTKRELSRQEAKESANMLSAHAEGTVSFTRAAGISNQYRSGEYKGARYMTSDDFVRYFRNRDNYNMPLALRNAQQSMKDKAKRPETVSVRAGAKRDSLVSADSGSKEGHLRTRVENFIKKWFPAEPLEGRTVGERFRFPTAIVGGMAALSLSLGLIVGGSVMIGNASGELGTLNSEISRLESQQTELQSQLDMKYNIDDIEEEAKSLGMINKKYAESAYIEVTSDEEIEIYEQEDTNVGFAALLNALGIKIG